MWDTKRTEVEYDDEGLVTNANEVHEVKKPTPTSTYRPVNRQRYVPTKVPVLSTTTSAPRPPAFLTPTTPASIRSQTEAVVTERRNQADEYASFYGPDYDAEYDLVQPKFKDDDNVEAERSFDLEEDTQMMSAESNDRSRDSKLGRDRDQDKERERDMERERDRERQMERDRNMDRDREPDRDGRRRKNLGHDGLPGFPPPKGSSTSTAHNSDAELAADGAGFVMENEQRDSSQTREQRAQRDQQRDEADQKERDERREQKTRQKLRDQSVGASDRIQEEMSNRFKRLELEKTHQMSDVRIQLKPTLVAPTIPAIPLQALFPQIPTLPRVTQKLPVFVEDVNLFDKFNIMRKSSDKPQPHLIGISVPQTEAPRVPVPRPVQRHPPKVHRMNPEPSTVQMSLSSLLHQYHGPQFPMFPAPFGTPFRAMLSRRRRSAPKSGSIIKYRPRREVKETNSSVHDNDKLEAAASGYFPFDDNEDQGIPTPVFNFDDFPGEGGAGGRNQRRYPSPTGRRSRKHRRPNHFQPPVLEPRHGKKYGILGSGNFEVIRGGIYGEDASASGSDSSYVRGHNGFKDSGDYDDGGSGSGGGSKKFTHPSDEDFFAADPVLGFQGYDNFHSASNQEEHNSEGNSKGSRNSPLSSQHSPVVFVDSDQDLMATA